MARLFGTDGIRGVANVDLKPTIAYALGRATAHRLVGPGGALVVGQDTRRSGDMFVAAIAAGACSLGAEVHVVGVVPTPALAYLAGSGPFAAGIMVSASHNPADDNGLKVLDGAGLKLDDAVEDELEQLIWRSDDLGGATNAGLGRIVARDDLVADYVHHRVTLASSVRATDTHLVLDARERLRLGRGTQDPAGDRCGGRGHQRRAGRHQHQRPLGGHGPGLAGRGGGRPGCPRRVRARRRCRPVDRGRRDRSDRRWRPDPRHPRPRSTAPRRPAGRRRGLGPLQRRPAGGRGGGRRPRRADARRRQVHPRGHAGVRRPPRRREERPRHRSRPHDIGRRHRHRARGPARHDRERAEPGGTRARTSRCCRSNSGP